MDFNITGEDLIGGYSEHISELTKKNVFTSAQLNHALAKIKELEENLLEMQHRLDSAQAELKQISIEQ